MPQQLCHDLDLLTPSQQHAQGHAGHPSHLHVVDDRHELVEEPQGQVGIFQAVYGQTPPSLLIAILQRCEKSKNISQLEQQYTANKLTTQTLVPSFF